MAGRETTNGKTSPLAECFPFIFLSHCMSRNIVALLSVVFVGYGELLTTLGAARSQYAAAVLGCHALAESMLVHAAAIVRLECSFHFLILFFIVIIHAFGLQNYVILFKYASFMLKLVLTFMFFGKKTLTLRPKT